MALTVKRKPNKFYPDPKRVITRYFFLGEQRTINIIKKVLEMSDKDTHLILNQTLRDFSKRHRNISKVFENNFDKLKNILKKINVNPKSLAIERKLLIGSYFTMEYSIESTAFFNPCVVEHPDQSELEEGQKRIIVSFRATGEGHISSIAFRMGIIDKDNNLSFTPPGKLVDKPEFVKRHVYSKKSFLKKLDEMNIHKDVVGIVMNKLNNKFVYGELQAAIAETAKSIKVTPSKENVLNAINWVANSHYEISFSLDTAISERVIFPVSYSESNGIEDARFVRFIDDDGSITYYATYTAFNGFTILPKLLKTKDFYNFKSIPLHGEYAQNKDMALFPRKINGKYAMISRLDGFNNYIMFSDEINLWETRQKIQEPKYPWEFIQIGNCGSPIETEYGWLLITHGVGPMRRYCLGATLLDLKDPTKIIGQLSEPLLMPNEEEREGYVPNVVYSCGSIINNNELVVPYAMSDYASTFATIPIDEIIDKLLPSSFKLAKKIPRRGQTRILLVDDEVITLKIVSEILKQKDYHVETASDGLDALMKIGKQNFDLVLSDINMPNLDGFHLLDFMKQKNINIPVVFMTGETDEDYEAKGLKLGAVEHIKKPIDKDILLLRLEKLLKK